ncbi:MraY family glycosyltransferase [Synechococcus sp. Cu2B8-bc1011]|uniref:MraY family glycosyltransferase n=1 Tax=Synechococcus sp. Cu2B8-bc1011 TaxID=3093725 RepID=UPI0039AED5C1
MFQAFVITAGTATAWLLLRGLIPQLRRGLLDQPNARSSHRQPTPRGGGVAFVAVASASSAMALLSGHGFPAVTLPLLAAPLSVVGLLDDRHNLPASWRYGVQLFTAVLMLGFSPLVQRLPIALAPGSLLLLPVLTLLVIAVTAVINFTNFMDGLDGLVAGCIAVTIATLAVEFDATWSLWALVGSLVGFLLWNWSPAKVFMGDVGSTFLGAVFAGLVLQASSWLEAFGYLLVGTPLLADACLCVLRRLLAGQPVFQAHRLHLFQRLHHAGWPHARVSLTYISATAVLAIAMLAGGLPCVFSIAVVELLLGVWLDQRVAVPFAVASEK